MLYDFEEYNFTYPVEEWLMCNFRHRLNTDLNYFQFAEEFAVNHVAAGKRKYGEFEQEWGRLRALLISQLALYKSEGLPFPFQNILIILGQALIHEYEGYPIPNLLR